MTLKEKEKRAEDLIIHWGNKLRLYNWTFFSSFVPKKEIRGKYAVTVIDHALQTGTIQLSKSIPAKLLEEVIVHELIHCWTNTLTFFGYRIVSKSFPEKAAYLLNDELDLKEEIIVENLAQAFLDLGKEKE